MTRERATSDPRPWDQSVLRTTLIALAQALLIAACLFLFLQGWRRDFGVPLSFSSDSLLALMQSKSTIDNGWWWFNPMLSAPVGLDELAFPANSNVDQAIVWSVSRLVRDPLTAINLAWMLMVVLSGLSASWSMRALGASRVSSVVAATLFALSPYALYRNIDHIWMVIYLVPFACTTALLLLLGRVPGHGLGRAAYVPLLIGCGILGFNYVYYPFFACFLIGVAAMAGFIASRRPRVLLAGGLCIALIGGCTLVNLAPSLYSWKQQGRPLIVRDKVPAESEVYGLKIRQLVSPVFQHFFPPFRAWTQREVAAHFPFETENVTSRLGLIGTVGFLGLLVLLFVPSAASRSEVGTLLLGAGQLTLASVLLGTVGGFGSLFSLLISPDIRAYNRISPFIAFFALTAVALTIDSFFKTRARAVAAAVVVLVVGLADQRMASEDLNAAYDGIAAEIPVLQTFVRQLETRLPDRAMVFQLPFRTYLNDSGIARMQAYEHLKLYAVSRRIRWSYPALSNDQVRWERAAAALNPQELANGLAALGFAAIVVDRYGYDDNGAATASIRDKSGAAEVIAETPRYVALDIRSLSGPATLGLATCAGQGLTYIDGIGSIAAPFGAGPLSVPSAGELKVFGWAVDQIANTKAGGVDVLLDETPFPTMYGTDREDVMAHFKRPSYLESGFIAAIPAEHVRSGPHSLALRVLSADRKCYDQTSSLTVVFN